MTADPLTAWLDTAQADADAATEGPWEPSAWVPGKTRTVNAPGLTRHVTHAFPVAERVLGRDAVFIAGARTRDPLMVAAIRDVLAKAAEWAAEAEGLRLDGYTAQSLHRCTDDLIGALSARLLGDDTPNETKENHR